MSIQTPSSIDSPELQTQRAPAIIRMRDVYKIYGKGPTEVRALDGVNLTIRAGEFVAVMGPSGSGKSSSLNLLGCLDVLTAGEYWFHGINVATLSRDELALLRLKFMGFVFQSYNLLPRTSAVANVELPLVYEGMTRRQRREMARAALKIVGLEHREHATPNQLSGGQQQRVAIARALVTSPPVLLADEPTGNLDTQTAEEIMNQFVSLRSQRNITIVMVTHEPEIAAWADRVLYFVDGRIEADGPPAEVLK